MTSFRLGRTQFLSWRLLTTAHLSQRSRWLLDISTNGDEPLTKSPATTGFVNTKTSKTLCRGLGMLFLHKEFQGSGQKSVTCRQLHDTLVGRNVESKRVNAACPITSGLPPAARTPAGYWKPGLCTPDLFQEKWYQSRISYFLIFVFIQKLLWRRWAASELNAEKTHWVFPSDRSRRDLSIVHRLEKISPTRKKSTLILHFLSIHS